MTNTKLFDLKKIKNKWFLAEICNKKNDELSIEIKTFKIEHSSDYKKSNYVQSFTNNIIYVSKVISDLKSYAFGNLETKDKNIYLLNMEEHVIDIDNIINELKTKKYCC